MTNKKLNLEGKIKEYLINMPIRDLADCSKPAHDIAEICEKEDTYWKREFERVANNYEKIWIENKNLKHQLSSQKHLSYEEVEKIIKGNPIYHYLKQRIISFKTKWGKDNWEIELKKDIDLAITDICNLAIPEHKTLNEKEVKEILESPNYYDVTQTVFGSNYRPDTNKMATALCNLVIPINFEEWVKIKGVKVARDRIIDVLEKWITFHDPDYDGGLNNHINQIASEILSPEQEEGE